MFQSFWVNGLLWKQKKNFSLGKTNYVSILLGQWITLEEVFLALACSFSYLFQSFWVNGLLWKTCAHRSQKNRYGFQSFWVNGLLWKDFRRFSEGRKNGVSILLGQWITLEGKLGGDDLEDIQRFNPSGSMDYFGSLWSITSRTKRVVFQSFWVNGLLWKPAWVLRGTLWSVSFNPSGSMDYFGRRSTSGNHCCLKSVSILLGQWITLEVSSVIMPAFTMACFNPSGSMDYFGRKKQLMVGPSKTSFNPSGSMDYFGSWGIGLLPDLYRWFQSFWVNGLLWKTRRLSPFLTSQCWVSILLGQWITLEAEIMTTG